MLLPFESFVTIVKSGTSAVVGEMLLQHRVFITKLVATRTAGSGDVSVELLSIDPDDIGSGEDAAYRVTDTVTTSSGVITSFFSYPRIFFSNDAENSTTKLRSGKLYIRLGTSGTGTFKIAVGGFSGTA